MTELFLALSVADRKEILQTAAAELGRQAAVLEKDIWVCWVLQILFSMPNAHPMAFKGGTSLSKIYEIINRFSEDVDVTIDYRHFDDDYDPFSANATKSQTKKFSERLKSYVAEYSNNKVVPYIRTELDKLPTADQHTIRVDENGEKIWVSFPSAVETSDEYLKSNVLIELGGRNVIDPNETHTITPYVAAFTPNLSYPTSKIVVLSPKRTFWEKATLIHVECNRTTVKESAERLSRHWYDLSMMANHESGKSAINDRDLFEDVIRHKQIFFNTSYANYDACLNGALNLLPTDDTVHILKSDYENMLSAGMMYESAPSFDAIIETIRQLTHDINNW